MSAFTTAFEIVVGHEGGFVDDPKDPGGRTKFGISQRAYPREDIAGLTLERARELYLRDYWQKAGCDLMDPGLALVCFDAAVNNGVGQAARWLQSALGVTVDGVIGPATRAALAKANAEQVLTDMHAARIYMMAGLPTWARFGRGWSKRLARLPYQAAKMQPDYVDQPPAGG